MNERIILSGGVLNNEVCNVSHQDSRRTCTEHQIVFFVVWYFCKISSNPFTIAFAAHVRCVGFILLVYECITVIVIAVSLGWPVTSR
jgi:hypothetical protein